MMKKIVPSIATASLLLLAACSTNKLAQHDYNDDVYYSVAQAKENVTPVYDEVPEEPTDKRSDNIVTDRDLYGDDYNNYSFSYADRIHRFHRYSPWRGYYDWYYDPFYRYYNPYAYNPYRYFPRWGFSIHVGYDPFFHDRYYNPYGWGYSYYGHGYPYAYHPYAYNRWGIYSYYNTYPGYGIGRTTYASPNYRPRPARGFDNITNGAPGRPATGRGSIRTDNDGRVIDTRTRAERYGDGRNTTAAPSTTGSRRDVSSSTRPTRTNVSRPTRSTSASPARSSGSSASPARTETRPTRTERYTPPPAPAPSNDRSSSSGSGRSSSGSSSSSGRPTRGN